VTILCIGPNRFDHTAKFMPEDEGLWDHHFTNAGVFVTV
jgi:hypothetical protein